MGKIFVLGIDGAMPEFIFGKWLDELPNIKRLMDKGCYAKLNSSIPPLSGTAWTSMTTGKKPADHGIFEYIYRKNHSYYDMRVVTSYNVKEDRIWHIASKYDKKSIACFVHMTWPIKPLNGVCISGFGAPDNANFTYPKEIEQEINDLFQEEKFILTVDKIETEDAYEKMKQHSQHVRELSKKGIIESAYKITRQHFKLMRYLIKNKEWDLFFGITIQSDAMNHNFFKFVDEKHREYNPDSEYRDVLKNYYKYVDKEVGELITLLDENTKIIILSDHGITRMHNRVNLTDWLIKESYMVLKENVSGKRKFDFQMVDWKKTKVFAIGAYDGQIFINLKDREPEGIVEVEEYNLLVKELEEKIKNIPGDDGKKLNTKVYVKKRDYDGKEIKEAPDMIIYFDDLEYGCNNSLIGNETLWSPQTAIGSDDAGHSRQGIFIMDNSEQKGDIGEIDIIDVAPTILNELDIKIPENMEGKIIK